MIQIKTINGVELSQVGRFLIARTTDRAMATSLSAKAAVCGAFSLVETKESALTPGEYIIRCTPRA